MVLGNRKQMDAGGISSARIHIRRIAGSVFRVAEETCGTILMEKAICRPDGLRIQAIIGISLTQMVRWQ